MENEPDQPVEIPITSVLDLHTFQPREVRELLAEYLYECRKAGIPEVRIIHGKGTGMLREKVHAILRNMPEVTSFRLADETSGSWGATIAKLQPLTLPEDKNL